MVIQKKDLLYRALDGTYFPLRVINITVTAEYNQIESIKFISPLLIDKLFF